MYHSSIPLHDYPPCLATELEFEKEVEFQTRWESITRDQLRSIRSSMSHIAGLPSDDDILAATKARPVKWDIKNGIKRCEHQSELSFTEQQFALALMVRTIDRYKECYHQSITKGVLNNGAPGAGKTFLIQCALLYGMCEGLRCITTSLMALRSKVLGGINMHQLFKLTGNKSGNLYRLAQVSRFKI